MTSSTFAQPLPPDFRDNAATGYRANGRPIEGEWHTYPEQAAAGLWTTPADLATFAIALQQAAAGHPSPVLSRTLAREMLRRHVENWGLGVGIHGQGAATCFGHSGANEGFRAVWIGYRDQASGVVVMTNSDAGVAVGSDLLPIVAREYGFQGLGPG